MYIHIFNFYLSGYVYMLFTVVNLDLFSFETRKRNCVKWSRWQVNSYLLRNSSSFFYLRQKSSSSHHLIFLTVSSCLTMCLGVSTSQTHSGALFPLLLINFCQHLLTLIHATLTVPHLTRSSQCSYPSSCL